MTSPLPASRVCGCGASYIPPLNRPTWERCPTCTFNPARRGVRALTPGPAYPLPPATSTEVTFTVPGKPMSVNLTHVAGLHRRTREFFAYRSNVRAHALQALGAVTWDLNRRYAATLTAYFATDRSDADNCVKPTLDALQGILWTNDRQVAQVAVSKETDPQSPRLVVTVRAID